MRVIRPHLDLKLKLLILLADLILAWVCYLLVFGLRFHIGDWSQFLINSHSFIAWPIALTVLILLTLLYIFGSYDLDKNKGFSKNFVRVGLSGFLTLIFITLLIFAFQLDRSGFLGRGVLIGTLGLFVLLNTVTKSILSIYFSRRLLQMAWLFVLSKDTWPQLKRDLSANNWGRYRVLLDSVEDRPKQDSALGVEFGHWNDFQTELKNDYSAVVVALNERKLWESRSDALMGAKFSGQEIADLSVFYERLFQKLPVFYLNPDYFFASEGFGIVSSQVRLRLKRLGDIVLATLFLIFAWPFMLLTALAVKLESKGPALFKQTRAGLQGENFTIYKFRSMGIDAEKNGARWASKRDPRVTRVGKFIRATRLDELPQLYNVLRGDMSFVGPRPERPEFNTELQEQIPYYRLRHLVRPGLTGWAQVRYPYGASLEDAIEKLQFELYYIKNYSLFLDLKIILKTIQVVVMGRGR